MKALFAFAFLLISANCWELTDTISEEEMTELYDALTAEPEVSEFARGQWEVIGLPGIVLGPKKGPAYNKGKHVKDIAYVKRGLKSFQAAVALVRTGLSKPKTTGYGADTSDDYKHYVCSYAYVKKAGYGHTVWCAKRDRFGDHTRMYSYKAGAFFTGGYML